LRIRLFCGRRYSDVYFGVVKDNYLQSKKAHATKSHKTPQNFGGQEVPGKRSFFVKSFGRDRLIVSNGKTGKCHFVAVQ
jgi:hypothetical protein